MRNFVFIAFFPLLLSCSYQPASPRDELTNQPQAVAMPDAFSARAAMEVLDDGGNAIDAAIAAQFVLAVTLPEAGNLGGGGFMTIYHNRRAAFLDYREMAPEGAHRDMYLNEDGEFIAEKALFGALAAGTPGTVAGMWKAHQRYGTLPWERLVQPAVKLARDGFIVPQDLADNVQRNQKRLQRQKIDSNFDEYFSTAKTGTLFKQPELADTLERIQNEGKDGFYRGKTADLITQFMQENGGLINHADLINYQALWREPLSFDWQGYSVITAPPPSSGGIAVAQILGMFEILNTNEEALTQNSPEYVHLMAEISKRVFADRGRYLGDPDFYDVPMGDLTADKYLKRRAKEVDRAAISNTDNIAPGLAESEDTTHFSIVDGWGNAVSNTTTINLSFGSSVVVTGAGFLLNDEMDDFSAKPGVANFFGAIGGKANEIQPHKRMLSSMTPTIVLKQKKVALVTGSPGGTTIISSVAQSVLNALHFNMTAEKATNAPRFHHQLLPKDTIRHHKDLPQPTVSQLREMGYTLDARGFGDVQLIKSTKDGLEAASEASGRGRSKVSPHPCLCGEELVY